MKRLLGIRYKDAPPHEFIQLVKLGTIYKLPKGTDKKRLERIIVTVPTQEVDEQNPIDLESLPTEEEFDLPEIKAEYILSRADYVKKHFSEKVKEERKTRQCGDCNNFMTHIEVCCDDRSAGIKEKWHCSVCEKMIVIKYKKNKG